MPSLFQERQRWPRGPRNRLHDAAIAGLPNLMEAPLEREYDINAGDLNGATPLIMASVGGHACIVEMLLSKGAEASIAEDAGGNALHFAAT